MASIAVKPCRFAGQSFKVGEIIPAEFLQPGASKNLVKMGIIAEEGGELVAPSTGTIEAPNTDITVVLHTAEGDMDLNLTPEGLQAVFDTLTGNVSEAEATINEMTDVDALILLDCSDKRKSVGELTKARAEALTAPQEGEESEGEE